MSRNDITGDEIKSKPTSDAYRQGHERLFGNKIQRGRWIQHPETGELIRAEDYAKSQEKHLDIFVDNFQPYQSPINDEVIDNRRKRDYDLKSSGCRPYEGRKIEQQEADRYHHYKDKQFSQNVQETIRRTMYEITHGYRKPS